MANFVTPAEVRAYLGVSGTTTNYTDGLLGSNINYASGLLQKRTNRLFEQSSNLTKTFSTRGRATLAIPDLRSAGSITWNDAPLTVGESVYLIPDRKDTGVFVGIEIPALRWSPGFQGSEWFDRNYDSLRWQSRAANTLPNDLVIAGASWGHLPYPSELLLATTILAAWVTRRANALLANAAQDATGAILDYSAWPPEVSAFVNEWRIDGSSGAEAV